MEQHTFGRNVASMLGGAAVGATLMYLFDPESGRGRRKAIANSVGKAARETGEALSSTWEMVREKAGHLGESAATTAGAIGSRASDIAGNISESSLVKGMRKQSSKLGHRASRWGSRASSRLGRSASDIGKKAGEFGGSLRERFGSMLHGRRETAAEKIGLDTGWKKSLAALGLIGLGAGAVYFFEPQRGSQRRRMIREKFISGYDRLAHGVEHGSRSIWDLLSGKSRRTEFSGQRPADRLVFERVRSEIGRCVSRPSLITAEVRRGRVTLSGPILASEVDGLMKALWNVSGVKEVINRLEIHESIISFPNVQTAEDAPPDFRSEEALPEANRI